MVFLLNLIRNGGKLNIGCGFFTKPAQDADTK